MPWDNPEIVRNTRMQLRPGRLIAALVVCLAISGTIWASIVHTAVPVSFDGLYGAGAVFAFTLDLQIAILLIGGGIFVLQSVRREKEQNTFDFQRVTRLSAFELAMGKLFGAPIGAYFVTLCFMPVALIGAIEGHVAAGSVAEAYAILLLGSIAFHTLALLISVVERRGAGVIGILFYLAALGLAEGIGSASSWLLDPINPFVAGNLVEDVSKGQPAMDMFFGIGVSHFVVLTVLYATLSAWFLAAAVRNIKREPSLYEAYSPMQALGFALFLSALLLGFYSWKGAFYEGIVNVDVVNMRAVLRKQAVPTQQVEQTFLVWSVWLFGIMAMLLLHNRERVRRRVQTLGEGASSLWAALWPAPYVMLGVALVGGSVVTLIAHYRYAGEHWNLHLAIYDVAFVAIWLSRDAVCIQWLHLRRAKLPFASAALYLMIFYGCTGTIFSALNLYAIPQSAALTGVLLPSPLFALNESNWDAAHQFWVIALFAQAAELAVFWWLQRRRLLEFKPMKASPSINEQAQLQSA